MVSTRRSSRLQRSTPQPPGSFGRDSSVGRPDTTPATLGDVPESSTLDTEEIVGSPRTTRNPFSNLLSKLSRTPKHKVAIQPTHEEMHPSQHQQSTTKPLDEARWLGFMPMTEPAKKSQANISSDAEGLAVAQATPTRVTQSAKAEAFHTPPVELKLSSKRKSSIDAVLSPEAQRIMAETREDAAKIRAKMTAAKEKQEAQDQHAEQLPVFGLTNALGARKIAKPRGRFSDAHKKAFGNMDSISNHPSAFRAAPARNATTVPLKAAEDQPTKQLKRKHSKTDMNTPPKSSLPVKTSFTPIPPRDASLLSPAKRLRHVDDADASTARPSPANAASPHNIIKPTVPASATTTRVKTGIPLPRSHLTTPTKASLARSQSAKSLRHATSIPMLAKSPSATSLRPSVRANSALQSTAQEPISAESGKINQLTRSPSVRSILRSGPTLLYSDDPAKIAAGTHIMTPKRKSMLPRSPATAPVKKHVEFTESTKERAELSELLSSPSSAKTLKKLDGLVSDNVPATVQYPSLDAQPAGSTAAPTTTSRPIAVPRSKLNRRQTIGPGFAGPAAAPGSFTFRAGKAPSFAAPTATSTIRHVRNSDVAASLSSAPSENVTVSKKRKLERMDEDEEGSDKENSGAPDLVLEGSPAKKIKSVAVKNSGSNRQEVEGGTAAQKAAKKGLFGGRTTSSVAAAAAGSKKPGLTMARLNMLATPKKRRT